MRINTTANSVTLTTHEGAPARRITPVQQLRRSVLSSLLWESTFYEDGVSIANRIELLCEQVSPQEIAALAIEARSKFHLRHVPLLLLKSLIKRGGGRLVSDTIFEVIQRADELAELVAVYWADGRKPLSNPMKRGLARAFGKFSAYSLAKYNRSGAVKLRDVLFLCHAKPSNEEQAAVWSRLIDGTLESPDTWEVALSAGADKGETFTRLIESGSLGYLALLRNLRSASDAGVHQSILKDAILRRRGAEKVLPFRYVAAARAVPSLESALDTAMLAGIAETPRLRGKTVVLVDVSMSMMHPLSRRSELNRMDAAATLASVLNCEDLRVFAFSDDTVEVPSRRGMSGVDAIRNGTRNGGTMLGLAVSVALAIPHDRLIVITDEQSSDPVPHPAARHSYMINVSAGQHGVGYGPWTHIDGFSENVIRFIAEHEAACV